MWGRRRVSREREKRRDSEGEGVYIGRGRRELHAEEEREFTGRERRRRGGEEERGLGQRKEGDEWRR